MKEVSRRDFVKAGVAAAASVGLLGLLKGGASAYEYGTTEEGAAAKIIRVKDPANMSVAEKKHSPLIQVEPAAVAGDPIKVIVSVGRLMHPMDAKHWIRWVELYAGDKKIARAELEPEVSRPVVTFTVAISGPTTLRALADCNLHGTWEETLQA